MATEYELRPAFVRQVGPENCDVYNNMPDNPPCLSSNPWDTVCLTNWSWDLTTCSDMMPFKVDGSVVTGVFRFVNNMSRANGIDVGTPYILRFPEPCQYVLQIGEYLVEVGSFSYSRASHESSSNGGGGYNQAATLLLKPSHGDAWESLWIATDRFSGTFQSKYGIAQFTITPLDPYYKVADNAHQ